MSSGETVAIKLPTLSPGSAASSELGSTGCVPPLGASPAWNWLSAPGATVDALALAAVVVSLEEDAAGELFPATCAPGGATMDWLLPLVVLDVACALVVSVVITE